MENREKEWAEELKEALIAHLGLLSEDELILIYQIVRKLARK